jgi:uncharacterized membrane protein YfcA
MEWASDVSTLELAALLAVALIAGAVDAIAGGGGLLTVPVLLATGLPPHWVLGTNKGQSVFGSLAALVRYGRAGLLDLRRARLTFLLGFLGSLLGAALVLKVRPDALRPIILVLLLFGGAVLAFGGARKGGASHAAALRPSASLALAGVLALLLGTYDGFFGPGTGTLLILGAVWLLKETPSRATANAKVVNFASNLAAVVLFAIRGQVVWRVALPMAGCQLLGGWLGAHLAVKGGDQRVKRVVLAVLIALVVKLAFDLSRA